MRYSYQFSLLLHIRCGVVKELIAFYYYVTRATIYKLLRGLNNKEMN